MNVYDLAHQLAAEMKKSPEYLDYMQAKEKAMENETQKALLDEYKRLQFQLQVSMAGGASPDPKELERRIPFAGVLLKKDKDLRTLQRELR